MIALRCLVWLVIVVFGVGAAKAAQYASVEALGQMIGFDFASLIGIVPVILILTVIVRWMPGR